MLDLGKQFNVMLRTPDIDLRNLEGMEQFNRRAEVVSSLVSCLGH